MWCLFKKLRGYLLFLQMCQLPVSDIHLNILRNSFLVIANLLVFEAGQAEPYKMAAGQESSRKPHLLAWYLYRAKSPLQPILDSLIVRILACLPRLNHNFSLRSLFNVSQTHSSIHNTSHLPGASRAKLHCRGSRTRVVTRLIGF